MAQRTILTETIEATAEKAKLDAACKQLLSDKTILAWIMKYTMEEYRDFEVDEIAERYIEGNPVVACILVHRNCTGNKERIHGEDTVDKTIEEGTVYFDIRFRAVSPKNGECVTLLINVEAQNDFYPGYSLIKRGIYYCCRMISGQYGTEFAAKQYDDIKKVYSVWICINPPRKWRHTITKYSMQETNLMGNLKEQTDSYDLLTVVMVCLGEPKKEGSQGITEMLSVLLSSEMNVEQKKRILSKDYGLAMTKKMETEVSQMCNYSKGVEEKGVLKMLCSLVKDGLLKLEDAAARVHLSVEEFQQKMQEAGY